MADTTHEAHVRGYPEGADPDQFGQDEHGLTVLSVSEADTPPAEPFHTVAERNPQFDPNAALRNQLGSGPGLQDSEAIRPAVWVDQDDRKAAVQAAEADVQKAQRQLDAAKAKLKEAKK